MGELRATYHEGVQDGYKAGYEVALNDVIKMIAKDYPDPNPLSSVFTPYIGDRIVDAIENMKG